MDILKLTQAGPLARAAQTAEDDLAVQKSQPAPPARPAEVGDGAASEKEDDRAIVERIEAMRAKINASSRSRLTIEREGDAGRFVYKILDPDTGKTMRQWPPDQYLELVAYLREQQGGLVNARA